MSHTPEIKQRLDAIEKRLGYNFNNQSLLEEAFTHSSFFLDRKQKQSCDNERLEFLGDSVLNLIVTSHLYSTCRDVKEGVMTQLKEQIVDASSLREYTEKLGIAEFALMGKGEGKTLDQSSITADLFEAILGAIYLDGGFSAARLFFMNHFEEIMSQKITSPKRNWKKELQERVQKEHQQLPEYEIKEEKGPPHKRTFLIHVKVLGKIVGLGEGSSKKEAEMQAAKNAIEKEERD